jgi:hypothetical protein
VCVDEYALSRLMSPPPCRYNDHVAELEAYRRVIGGFTDFDFDSGDRNVQRRQRLHDASLSITLLVMAP